MYLIYVATWYCVKVCIFMIFVTAPIVMNMIDICSYESVN